VDAIPSDSAASLTLPGSEGGLVDADGVGVVMGGDEGSTAPVFFATAISMLGPLMFGFSLGFTSPTSRQLTGEDCKVGECSLVLTDTQLAFFGAVINVGAMFGATIGGTLADRVGRANTLGLASLPFLIGYTLIGLADGYGMLLLGRLLTGIGVGVVSLTTPVYIAEVAPTSLRGMLGSGNQLAITLGVMLVYMLGLNALGVTWRGLALLGTVPSAGLLLGSLTVLPETPRWLCSVNKMDKAAKSLKTLRGTSHVDTELASIQSALRSHANEPKATLKDLLHPGLRQQLTIGVGIMILQQFSGINAIIFYSKDILHDAGIENADLGALAVGGIQVLMTVICCQLMDRAGRRKLLLISTAGMAFSTALLSVYFNFKKVFSPAVGTALSFGSLVGDIVFFSLGLGAIPWILMSEIFPSHTRGLASSVATLVNWSCSFVITQIFSAMMKALTPGGAFLCYALELIFTFMFVLRLVPETKGRSLEQLEVFFQGGGMMYNTHPASMGI